MGLSYIMNGQGFGDVASILLASNMDPRALRPYTAEDGRTYIDRLMVQNGKQVEVPTLITNAPATLTKNAWQHLDTAVLKAARSELQLVNDILGAGLEYTLPNGMGTTVFQTQDMTDSGSAHTSMDGITRGERDRPEINLHNMPMPITFADFDFTLREISVSKNTGAPLDTTQLEQNGRKIAEQLDSLFLGTAAQYTYGGGTLYGLTNHPDAIAATITSPTAGGWTPNTLITEVIAMRQQAKLAFHRGPFRLYMGTSWDIYLDEDYSAAKGTNTLRQRMLALDRISGVKTLDTLAGYTIIMVEMRQDVVRAVTGMNLVNVQWETEGGMLLHFKTMIIQNPQIRSDANGNTGLVVGTV